MTRARIVELLDALILELANNVPPPAEQPRGEVPEHEWAYVKGLASHAVITFKQRLEGAPF